MSRPPLPPFTHDAAIQKVRLAEDVWNGRDLPIAEPEPLYHWPAGRRSDDQAGLAELGL